MAIRHSRCRNLAARPRSNATGSLSRALDLQRRVHVERVVGGDHGGLPLPAAQAGGRHARVQQLQGLTTGFRVRVTVRVRARNEGFMLALS